MKCVYHSDREAEFVCSSCGQPVCRECITSVNGKNVCKACAYKSTQYNMGQQYQPVYKRGDGVNSFLFFIFLAVPGIRHMYLGLMNRGLQFLIAFFSTIALGILLGDGIGEIAIPVAFIIWFYSAFDSYQYRKLMARGERVEDKPIFEEYGIEDMRNFLTHKKKYVGIATVILGVYLLVRRLRWYIGTLVMNERTFRILSAALDFAFDCIIPILLILAGVYLINSVRKKSQSTEEQ